jgi:glycosyltransferase involved in cell wall biosynthesis
LKRSAYLKKALWPLQKRALERADMLHATSEAEYHEIRALGLKAPVVILPNGIDVPERVGRSIEDENTLNRRTLLFLSRIHPKKGIDRLLNAWAALESQHLEWDLVIAGTGESAHVEEIKVLIEKLGVKRVDFVGPLYGDSKAAAYQNAELFVLPTHSENFGMAVAEALAHGCPAVVGTGAPWAGLRTEECGWWVEITVESLKNTLSSAFGRSREELQVMGERGRKWMEREYGWSSIAQKMNVAYQWLCKGGERPEFVRVD